MVFIDVLPLRAVIFQFFFLIVAIAIEAVILYRNLVLDYKTSMQYAATANMLAIVLGWIIFFLVQPFLPQELKIQLISYIFFEQFFTVNWFDGITPVLIFISVLMFIGTFFVKWQGLELLERILGKQPEDRPVEDAPKFRGRHNQVKGFRASSKAYAVLMANAWSFSIILFLLFVRLVEQQNHS